MKRRSCGGGQCDIKFNQLRNVSITLDFKFADCFLISQHERKSFVIFGQQKLRISNEKNRRFFFIDGIYPRFLFRRHSQSFPPLDCRVHEDRLSGEMKCWARNSRYSLVSNFTEQSWFFPSTQNEQINRIVGRNCENTRNHCSFVIGERRSRSSFAFHRKHAQLCKCPRFRSSSKRRERHSTNETIGSLWRKGHPHVRMPRWCCV